MRSKKYQTDLFYNLIEQLSKALFPLVTAEFSIAQQAKARLKNTVFSF